MTLEEFVKAFKDEKARIIKEYFSDNPQSTAGALFKSLELSDAQTATLRRAIDTCLTDTFYTVLLGLDGSTGIGSMQHTFKIYDEDNNLLSDCGDLEAEAYRQFHEELNES